MRITTRVRIKDSDGSVQYVYPADNLKAMNRQIGNVNAESVTIESGVYLSSVSECEAMITYLQNVKRSFERRNFEFNKKRADIAKTRNKQ